MASGESIYARLRMAHKAGRVPGAQRMEHALTLFAAECSLRRMGAADMLAGVVLKGGRLWSLWGANAARPTQDFDYSSQEEGLRGATGDVARAYAARVLRAVSQDCDDGLVVDPADFRLSYVDSKLGGCAIEGRARLHTAEVPLVIEIGFGHELPAGATEILPWKPLLPGVGSDIMLETYRREMWLAEKLRIAVAYGDGNTRLKDFWDMRAMLASPLDQALLLRCFEATCRDFGTVLPECVEDASGLSQSFAERNARLWRERRWPEWTGKPFMAGRDPSFEDVVADVAARVAELGLLPSASYGMGRMAA